MFYGLSRREKDFADHLMKVVQLAPCFVFPTSDTKVSIDTMNSTLMKFRDLGVHAINGPNLTRNRETLCNNFSAELCNFYKSITGRMGQGVESEIYWAMNQGVQRFQEKQDDKKWLAGELQKPLVPLENIHQAGTNLNVYRHN